MEQFQRQSPRPFSIMQQASPPPPPATSAALLTTIESAFLSGAYSDLIIQCNGRVFHAHKLIVCGQSEWFAKAVKKDGFQEGQTGVIDFPYDEPAVVKAVLQYLYMFDYAVPDDLEESIAYSQARTLQQNAQSSAVTESSADHLWAAEPAAEAQEQDASYGGDVDLTGSRIPSTAGIGRHRPETHSDYLWRMYHRSLRTRSGADEDHSLASNESPTARETEVQPEYDERALPPMLFHINVYALADRIQHTPLKQLAETKFGLLAIKEWKSPDFPAAVEAVYSVAPPGNAGDALRTRIVRLVVSHAKELFSLDRGFTAMLQETPDFAADLARALSGAGMTGKGPEINIDVEELCCPGCKFIMRAALSSNITMLSCPLCKWDGIVSRWRNGMKDQGVLKKGRRSVLTSSWEL